RRLRHGPLPARRRRGTGDPGPVPGLCLLERLPLEPLPAHLQLRLRAGHPQRRPVPVRARRLVGAGRLACRPRPSELDLHGRPPLGVDLVPLVPARAHARRAGGGGRTGGDTAMTTGDRPPPIALDDLVEPRFDDTTREVLALMADMGASVSLDGPSLLAQATAETGLDDLGANDVTARLEVLCRALREEAGLNGAGVLTQSVLLTGLLKNRLLIQDLLARHPEIRDEVIAAPIVICGLPRTGTTHLHTLLSADDRLRSLPYWESLEPV